MSITIIQADYLNPQHAADLGYLLNCYATDPMGGGVALTQRVQEGLAAALSKVPHAFSLLGYADSQPVALANCFEVFSTFKCQPIVNIHDLVVTTAARGKGMGQQMLAAVEKEARARGCCKITLEVLQGNQLARQVYEKFGFGAYELDPRMGQAIFLDKTLD